MIRTLLLFVLSFCLINAVFAADAPKSALDNPDVQAFITKLVKEDHFKRSQLEKWFSQVKFQQRSIELMNRPYEALPWYQYKKYFISKQRIKQGVKFWHRYASVFNAVSQRTGVPAPILVSIVGVETHYGTVKASFSAFNVLYSLGFYYPRRATFFRRELQQLLLLCREQGFNPLTVNASYAGAMGQPQFMPSSYRAYAVAFKPGAKPDLFNNEADVIASVGNYFAKHHWLAGQPVTALAIVTGDRYKKLPIQDRNSRISLPKMSLTQFRQYGVRTDKTIPLGTKATFIRFDLKHSQEYWLGFKNFYVITRYNTSKLYAMAVYQLSQAVNKQYQKQYPTK